MILAALLLASSALGGAAPADPAPEATPTKVIGAATTAGSAHGRLTGFAVELAGAAPITGPGGWRQISDADAWKALAAASPATRQSARWAYARSLIGQGRGQEARGVLETMLRDDGDLALVESFQLALGAARAEAGDASGAVAALGSSFPGSLGLAQNPEACAWRLWSLVALERPNEGLAQIRCALPALNHRSPADRAPFYYAGARAALAIGRPAPVPAWLASLPDNDAGANLYRGRAALALGDLPGARLRLARVTGGSRQQQIDASVSLLEADLASGAPTPAQMAQIDHLAFVWRGDAIEQRVLELSYRIAVAQHDLRRSLAAGAALVRHCKLGVRAAPLLAELQTMLSAGLASGSTLPITEAAGLYWDFRDLAPTGAQGDFLASQLADRLQDHGLYARAADLLHHQLVNRAEDIAQGPLSTHVASLYILAGRPTQALAAIHDTEFNAYPAEMQWDRHRIEAVALYRLGRRPEALAALQDVPDGGTLRAEIAWKSHDWSGLVAETGQRLPAGPRLGAVDQAIILRYAIALAMLGREPALAQLNARYAAAFGGLPAAVTFDLLTRDATTLDATSLATAMLAIPSASPAGTIGDLFDVPVTEPRPVKPRATI